MQPLWSIITLIAMTAPTVASTDGSSSEGVADAVEFGQLDAAGQQEWIRKTIVRLDRANQLVLPPDKAAQYKARYTVLLRQVDQGRQLLPAEAEDLLRQADRREKAAIERLARTFRIQVYQTFRQRRGTFTRRRAAWSRVLAGWEAAGSSFEEQERLIDWLQAATRASLPDSVGPMPADPEFTIAGLAPESLVLQKPIHPTTPRPVETPMPRPALSDYDRPAIQPPSFVQPDVETPNGATPEPRPLPPVALSTNEPRVIAESPITDDTVSVAQPPVSRLPLIRQPLPRQQPTASSPTESIVSVEPPVLPEAAPRPPSVGVNIEELAARTAGVNLGIRALEAELTQRGPWNSIRLRPLVDRLGKLTNQRKDLSLFHQIVAEEQRPTVGRLESPGPLIAQVAARIFEARTGAGRSDFEGSEWQRRAELQQLDELSRRLAQVASGD